MDTIDRDAQRRQALRNRVQALLLLGGMAAVLAVCAWLVAGPRGILWALIAAVVALALQPKVPTGWVLRAYGAIPLPPSAGPQLHRIVGVLAQRAGLPRVPRLHLVPSTMLNAFAVGRPDDPALAVTDGLLRRLPPREVVAVLAHEVSHLRADDPWIMTLADTIGRITHLLAYAGLALLLLAFPVAATGGSATPLALALVLMVVPTVITLLQLALSRSREYDADLAAARLTGDPEGLARALQRLEQHEGRIWERIMVPHRRSPDSLLLRTHPPTADRVSRLLELVPEQPDRHIRVGGLPLLDDRPRVTRPTRLHPPGVRW